MRSTTRLAEFVVRHARAVTVALALATLFFLYPLVNTASSVLGYALPGPRVRIDSNAREMFPVHKFIHAQDKFEGFFGNASPVVLAKVVKEGTIYNPESLAKLKRLTAALDGVGFESYSEQRNEMRDALEESGIEDIGVVAAEAQAEVVHETVIGPPQGH